MVSMKKIYICLFLIPFCLTACKKDDKTTTPPVADFTFNGNTSNSIIINESTTISLLNNSQNAVSFLWDMGNRTTTEKQPVLNLKDGGDYTISLTVKNSNGQAATTKKHVRVVAPVLKSIVIKSVDWSLGAISAPNFSKADVWVEITKQDSGRYYKLLPNGSYDAPVFYKSKVYQNAIAKNAPIELSVDEKLVMNQNTILDDNSKGKYGINLYGKDATGTYLLYTSDYSGVGTGPFKGSLTEDYFEWNMGFNGFRLSLTGDYE
jgi:PKD repeat protein